MKKLIFSAGDILNATSSFVSISNNYSINQNNPDNKTQKDILKIIENSKLNKDILVDEILSSKTSAISISKQINDKNIKDTFKEISDYLLMNNKINELQYKEIYNSINDNLANKFKKEFRNEILKHRKEIRTNPLITNLFNNKKRLININESKNYSITIDDEQQSSKSLLVKLLELQEKINEKEEIKELINKEIKRIEVIIKSLKIALISTSVISIFSSFFSLFFPVISFISLGVTVSSISLNIAVNHFETQRKYLYQRLENMHKLNIWEASPFFNVLSYTSGAINLKQNSIFSLLIRKMI
ncbi:hypothetical protein RRG40_04440 [Mycoplasmopsis felis]|uniref:hypothetical protein n=1 Tax=Mycoplasmopsis felis TaxID=33923 RepID=UPI002AFE1947|nr:hypothetical protein [Mycoplasmopsis felis]WQQ05370.1 hypothetical protein RRG59_03400 [Mycoplasmopsis felis]